MFQPVVSGARVSASGRLARRSKGAADRIFTAPLGQIAAPGLFQPGRQPVAQRAEFGFLAFEQPQACPQGFRRILVAPGSDQTVDQSGLGFGQNDVSGGHAALLQDYWQYMPTMAECRCLPGERVWY